MTWGLSAHRVTGGEPEVDRLRFERIADARGPGTPEYAAAPHVQAILALHRQAGNAAVVHLLRRDRTVGSGRGRVIQRQDEDEEAGQSWGTDETSGEATYGPPPPPGWSEDGGPGQGWSQASGQIEPAAEPEPATEPSGGGGGASGSSGGEWSGGGGSGGGGDAGGSEPVVGPGSGGGEGGSSWWPFGGGEETPRNEPGQAAPGGDGGGSSWWPFGGGDDAPTGGEEPGAGGEDSPFSADEIAAKQEEGQPEPVEDVTPPIRSSPIHTPPTAGSAGSVPGGFHDHGRTGTVPFGSVDPDAGHDPFVPHAITTGGRTGSIAWSGGGKAGGPKGNQGTGKPSFAVEPKYDTSWNGPFAYASAWVMPGTGVFDVHRDYVSSNAGDQGNGWWISQRAATALEAHEVRHLEAAKSVYASRMQPLLDRVAKSKSMGYHTDYLASHAIIRLQGYVNWAKSVEKWVDEDAAYNADGGQIDTEDYVSPAYPHNQDGPKTIAGKEYKNYLVMNDEDPPPP